MSAITGGGFVYRAIRREFIMPQPWASISLCGDYCFYTDLPAGAWLDAPETVPAGSHSNFRGVPMPSIAWRE